ncbi:hypothetical protein Scep_014635 [Stephania cephalantha]|uniref:Uncharacterized protein n=1 Tax=Stephania cephalantha TaxID=152367 RepID=A0AAP0J1L9_9MAGN
MMIPVIRINESDVDKCKTYVIYLVWSNSKSEHIGSRAHKGHFVKQVWLFLQNKNYGVVTLHAQTNKIITFLNWLIFLPIEVQKSSKNIYLHKISLDIYGGKRWNLVPKQLW